MDGITYKRDYENGEMQLDHNYPLTTHNHIHIREIYRPLHFRRCTLQSSPSPEIGDEAFPHRGNSRELKTLLHVARQIHWK